MTAEDGHGVDSSAVPTISVNDLLGVIARMRQSCSEWHYGAHDGTFENCDQRRCRYARGA